VSAPPVFKDHFSSLACAYSEFRPTYPHSLLDYVAGLCAARRSAWDCACGSGQATIALAERFERVLATDASAKQIACAPAHPGVSYRVSTAEASGLETDSVDLVAVGQAAHWFDLKRFYVEVQRVLRRDGILALWSYGPLHLEIAEVDRLVQSFYHETVGPFWPAERRLVDEGYRQLPFPYLDITPPPLRMHQRWSLPRLMGYLRSWSATGRYVEQYGEDPVVELEARLEPLWGEVQRERLIEWPLALRAGRKP
jgi:SAM-dependent methyltransferase